MALDDDGLCSANALAEHIAEVVEQSGLDLTRPEVTHGLYLLAYRLSRRHDTLPIDVAVQLVTVSERDINAAYARTADLDEDPED